MNNYWNQSKENLESHYGVNAESGLSDKEVAERLLKHGHNVIESQKEKGIFIMFLEQFKDFMIITLIIAAIISGIMGSRTGEGLVDTIIIAGILLVNAIIGVYQEKKAQSSLKALQSLSSPNAKVIRNGKNTTIKAADLVPGDIIIIETGDIVPADVRIIEAYNLRAQESSMTGESLPVEKNSSTLIEEETPLGDRVNMLFSSGIITYGRGKGIVVGTGMNTEIGKIAKLLQESPQNETPMKKRLEKLGKILGISILAICTVIFTIGMIHGQPIFEMFLTAVSLAVAAIPEGLPVVSTLVLAVGVRRLVKKNAIIRNLPSVETLGSAGVICSDKTGTLTQNKMTIVDIFDKFTSKNRIITAAALCNDAYSQQEDGAIKYYGDPTETSIIEAGEKEGIKKSELNKKYPRVDEVPFDSERKRMSTINRSDDNKLIVNCKGGLDEVLSICKYIEKDGKIEILTKEDINTIVSANELMAIKALRVLAVAYKEIDSIPEERKEIEHDLVFIGLMGMIDPPRREVIDAVKECISAGIRPIMITGDHMTTAVAIASEIGIYREGDKSITGKELHKLDDKYLEEHIEEYSVYARVAPEQKVRIVKAWQKMDKVVAMTGDGVNDAPALKQADIGASMGITGTDVAKDASDMILTDDNFATIVTAVKEGRRIYDNITKVITKLSTNVGELFLLLGTGIMDNGLPLLPIHILWVNLVTDSFPAIALSMDPAEKDIMNRKPIKNSQGIMTKSTIWRILYQGVIIGAIPFVAFNIGLRQGGLALGQTMAFASLVGAQLFHIQNLHSNTKSMFTFNPLNNIHLIFALLIAAVLAIAVLTIQPLMDAFRFVSMSQTQWLYILALSISPVIIVEIFKLLKINGK